MQAWFAHNLTMEELEHLMFKARHSSGEYADDLVSYITGRILYKKPELSLQIKSEKELLTVWLQFLKEQYESGGYTATLQYAWEHMAGRFMPKDFEEGLRMYKAFAKKTDTYGYEVIGHVYYEGEFVEADYEKAFYYMTVAGFQQSSQTTEFLAEMYYQGLGVKEDHARAAELYHEIPKGIDDYVIVSSCIKAGERLSEMYRTGDGVDRDLEQAEKYKRMASIYRLYHPLIGGRVHVGTVWE